MTPRLTYACRSRRLHRWRGCRRFSRAGCGKTSLYWAYGEHFPLLYYLSTFLFTHWSISSLATAATATVAPPDARPYRWLGTCANSAS